MNTKFKNRVFGILLAFIMAVSAASAGQPSVYAADNAINVTVAEVAKQYDDAKDILDIINEYRNDYRVSAVQMDEKLMEKAFLRATELSVYASTTRPDGTKNLDGLAQLIGYDVWSNASLVDTWSSYSDSLSILSSSAYKSVGVGVVDVNGYKYVCALFSTKASTGVDESLYTQYGVVVDQTISALPSVLSERKMGFTDGMQVYCGASINSYVYVTNKMYPSVGAYLTADNMNVVIEKPDYFEYTYNKLKAVSPGTSRITISSKEDSSVSVSATLKAVSMSFENCSVASIPDQYYTGSAVCPKVSIKNSSGVALVLGNDYTVEYKNNVQVGTASVIIRGIGSYAGQLKTVSFKIVMNTSSVFSITASVVPSSITIGDSASISVKTSGAVTPVTYTYQYALSGSSSWTKISSSTNATCSFKPSEAKDYNIKVTAVDNAGRTASQTLTLNVTAKLTGTVSLNKSSYSLGEKSVITANQQGGVGTVTYAFFVREPSASGWTTLQNFSSVSYYNYVPQNPGEYTVCVKFKSSSGQETKVYKTFNVTGKALENNSSISSGSVYLGQSVTCRGVAANGSGSYQYAYLYKLASSSSWTSVQAFSTKTSVSFSPKKEGTFDVCVKVKDSTGNIVKKYFKLTCTQAFSNNSAISASKINLGKSVTVSASSNSTKTCTYGVWYHTKGTTGWSQVQDFSANSKIAITPTKSGAFEACVKIKDSTGAIAVKYFDFYVNPKFVNKTTFSSLSLETGGSVSIKCAASGGSGTYTYMVRYRKSGASSWTTKQSYGSNTSVSMQFSAVGTYEVCVSAKDGLGDVAEMTKTITVKTPIVPKLTVSKSSIVCGQKIAFSVTATGGTGGFTYAFYYKEKSASNWIEKQKFSTNTKVEAKPSKASDYEVCVKVKDSSGTVQKTYGSFKVTPAVSLKISLSASTIVKGQTTTVTAAASNGSGGYKYAVYLKNSSSDKWSTVQDFGTNAKVSLKPAYSGAYQVCVKAKDSIGGVAKVFADITVKPSIENTSTVSATSIKLKSSVTVTTSAKNGSGGYSYAVLYKKLSAEKWTVVQDFKSSSKVIVTPVTATTYDICVKAKDSTGTVSKKYFTVKVTA